MSSDKKSKRTERYQQKLEAGLKHERQMHERFQPSSSSSTEDKGQFRPSEADHEELVKWQQLESSLSALKLSAGDVKYLMCTAFERRHPAMSMSTAYWLSLALGRPSLFRTAVTQQEIVVVPPDAYQEIGTPSLGIWKPIGQVVDLVESIIQRKLFAQCKIVRLDDWKEKITEHDAFTGAPIEFDPAEEMRLLEIQMDSQSYAVGFIQITLAIQRFHTLHVHCLTGFSINL